MGIYDELAQLEDTKLSDADAVSRKDRFTPRHTGSRSAVVAARSPSVQRARTQSRRDDVAPDATHDVVTSLLKGVDQREWREVLENSETRNSALRVSSTEREAIEDLVRDLARREKVKTSMNELARLGLLVLAHDYRQRGKQSVVYRVMKS